jgi:hypothetical protein
MNPSLIAAFASVLAATASIITALALFRGTRVLNHKVDEVHQEVRTFNEKTLGTLGAEEETRRALAISHDERTAREQRHIDQSPPEEPAQGPGV